MATKKKAPAKKAGAKKAGAKRSPSKKAAASKVTVKEAAAETPAATSNLPELVQEFLSQTSVMPSGSVSAKSRGLLDLRKRVTEINAKLTVSLEQLLETVNHIKPAAAPVENLPEDVKASIPTLKPEVRRFHGAKIPLYWFPLPWLSSACADKFG